MPLVANDTPEKYGNQQKNSNRFDSRFGHVLCNALKTNQLVTIKKSKPDWLAFFMFIITTTDTKISPRSQRDFLTTQPTLKT